MKSNFKKIPCSVGILTYNSSKNLRRALESVKNFSEIIISDGGSTDNTIKIAKEYGAKIINQTILDESTEGEFHPIEDFSKERNHLLSKAKEEWFFWLDSDEYISERLSDEIEGICNSQNPPHCIYEVERIIQSPEADITFCRAKPVYQVRLFNKTSGGHYIKKMHERIDFNREKFSLGRLKNGWFVPISKSSFNEYKKVVSYRLQLMLADHPPETIYKLLEKGIILPIKGMLGIFYRCIETRIVCFGRNPMPVYYYLYQLYSQYLISVIVFKMYMSKNKTVNKKNIIDK